VRRTDLRHADRLGAEHGFNREGGQLADCTEGKGPVAAHGRQRTRELIDGTIDERSGLNRQQLGASRSENDYDDGRNACRPMAH
jgi:hypothetical protein